MCQLIDQIQRAGDAINDALKVEVPEEVQVKAATPDPKKVILFPRKFVPVAVDQPDGAA